MNLLLSYPRSGNTWVRYIVEFISKRPTWYKSDQDGALGSRSTILGTNLNAPPILIKRHWIEPDDDFDINNDKLILLIRSYKEAMIRHHKENSKNFSSLSDRFKEEMRGKQNDECDYIKVIQNYDEWLGPKLLIYYEDLITNPTSNINKIATFLDIQDRPEMQELFSKLDEYHIDGIKTYHSKSWTGGLVQNLNYHQQLLDKKTSDMIAYHIKTNFPSIYKYVARYE